MLFDYIYGMFSNDLAIDLDKARAAATLTLKIRRVIIGVIDYVFHGFASCKIRRFWPLGQNIFVEWDNKFLWWFGGSTFRASRAGVAHSAL